MKQLTRYYRTGCLDCINCPDCRCTEKEFKSMIASDERKYNGSFVLCGDHACKVKIPTTYDELAKDFDPDLTKHIVNHVKLGVQSTTVQMEWTSNNNNNNNNNIYLKSSIQTSSIDSTANGWSNHRNDVHNSSNKSTSSWLPLIVALIVYYYREN